MNKVRGFKIVNCQLSVVNYLVFLFLITYPLSLIHAQAKIDTVTEADYYEFFNSTTNPFPVTNMGGACNPDTLKTPYLISTPEFGVLRNDTTELFHDTIFSKADKAYIRKQWSRLGHFTWTEGKMNGMKVIDGYKVRHLMDSVGADSGWAAYFKIYRMGYNTFSVPLFSVDKTKCIVYRGFQCGNNWGLGNTNAFIKRNGKWAIAHSCGPWVH